MTDAKARKVIVIENTFMPNFVKEHLARALFENLRVSSPCMLRSGANKQVPSIAFTASSLLSLAACGRITGLVVDCGWLETTVTPVRSL